MHLPPSVAKSPKHHARSHKSFDAVVCYGLSIAIGFHGSASIRSLAVQTSLVLC